MTGRARRVLGAAIGAAVLFDSVRATADLVPGGPAWTAATDCYAELDVADLDSATVSAWRKRPVITCVDGAACDQDGTVNRRCVFSMRTCINQRTVGECVPPERLESLKAAAKARGVEERTYFPPQPLAGSTCGAFVDLGVPIARRRRLGVGSVRIKARTPDEAPPPHTDSDRVRLECLPPRSAPVCPANAAGGPNRLAFTTSESGTDLDTGWTGAFHGFAFAPGTSFGVCLSECDATTDTTCTAKGPVGLDTPNGDLFGAPLPLLAANVPLCVVNHYVGPIAGTADFATGDVTLRMGLRTSLFFTDPTEVCPRCTNGRCTSGENVAGPCAVDATVVVADGFGNPTYDLSKDCLPLGSPYGMLDLVLDPLASGRSAELVGPTPCPGTASARVDPRPNGCAAGCGAPCEGSACGALVPDPSDPTATICADRKGGLSQVCCHDDPTWPCFPLDGGGVLGRTGRAERPVPRFPDPGFPKSAEGALGAVTCAGSAGGATVDVSVGLPGPVALLLTGRQDWRYETAE